jgi:hypothetical protein
MGLYCGSLPQQALNNTTKAAVRYTFRKHTTSHPTTYYDNPENEETCDTV